MNNLFYQTIQKYGLAISQNLHPSQTSKLKQALNLYEEGEEVYIADSYVRLAFEMIVSDYLYQNKGG